MDCETCEDRKACEYHGLSHICEEYKLEKKVDV